MTHRGVSTHFTVVTGHEDPAKDRTDVDWDALARAGGTLVILMGAGRIGDIARRLIDGGRVPPTRRSPRCATAPVPTSARCAPRSRPSPTPDVRAPSAIVVGDVAALDLAWFEARPLFGRSVVVTRAREQASELRARLEALGAEVVELPAIAIEPVDVRRARPRRVRVARVHVGRTASTRSSTAASRRPASTPARSRACGSRRSAPAPQRALDGARHRAPTSCPSASSPSRCSRRFPTPAVAGARVLLARAEQARDVLPDGLGARGYAVDVLAGVPHRAGRRPTPTAVDRVRAGEVDAITFTSSSTVDNFCDLARRAPRPAAARGVDRPGHVGDRRATAASASTPRPTEHTIDGLVAALAHRSGVSSTR